MNREVDSGAAGAVSVALAHDYLLVLRGAERTFAAIADAFADAPINTLVHDPRLTASCFPGRTINASFLQRLRARQRGFRALLPLYPHAAQRMRVTDCDLLISSSSAFAHGMRTEGRTLHICYCHTPFRYAWHERNRALQEVARPLRPLLSGRLRAIQRWDVAASERVDLFIANSAITRRRIGECYGREAEVLHPPVDTARFGKAQPGEALLVVGELVAHKRTAVALAAARAARVPIDVVGSGPERAALEAEFPEARMHGRLDDRALAGLYSRARAVLVPSVEEFGIVAVEAQAAGRPVIAAAAGGALETVIDGETGILAEPNDAASFQRAIEAIDTMGFRPQRACENAERFSIAAFTSGLRALVGSALAERRARPAAT